MQPQTSHHPPHRTTTVRGASSCWCAFWSSMHPSVSRLVCADSHGDLVAHPLLLPAAAPPPPGGGAPPPAWRHCIPLAPLLVPPLKNSPRQRPQLSPVICLGAACGSSSPTTPSLPLSPALLCAGVSPAPRGSPRDSAPRPLAGRAPVAPPVHSADRQRRRASLSGSPSSRRGCCRLRLRQKESLRPRSRAQGRAA